MRLKAKMMIVEVQDLIKESRVRVKGKRRRRVPSLKAKSLVNGQMSILIMTKE